MLPKGTEAGITYQFVAIVSPWEGTRIPSADRRTFVKPGTPDLFFDNKHLQYPFDRLIKFEKMWYQIPNIHFHDEKIYHKEADEVNASHH